MIRRFLAYVEIRTKITSLFAFAMGLMWLFCLGQAVNWKLTGIFFASMFLFDLTTTAINNYIDTKTNGQGLPFSRPAALAVIIALLAASTLLGLWLALLTDMVVLSVGGLCFICGVFYTFGPVPISRIPLGEILSGVFYGLLIPFLLLYINLPDGTLLTFGLTDWVFTASLSLLPLLALGLICWTPMVCTANIMLANNICDLEKDIAVGRHTLPYYFGKQRSVFLYGALYYSVAPVTLLLVLAGFLPAIYLLTLAVLFPARKNIREFRRKQVKSETFATSIRNFILLMSAQVAGLALSGIWIHHEIF